MNRSVRVVIADDEEDIREYFQYLLPRWGYEVVAAAQNGRELVEQCRALAPDLVITDLWMPEMDGLEAAEAIYREHRIAPLLMSAHFDDEPPPCTNMAHVLGHLVKPIRQAELRAALDLARRAAGQAPRAGRQTSEPKG
jgi:YesN/AraC family two-component response regulator